MQIDCNTIFTSFATYRKVIHIVTQTPEGQLLIETLSLKNNKALCLKKIILVYINIRKQRNVKHWIYIIFSMFGFKEH